MEIVFILLGSNPVILFNNAFTQLTVIKIDLPTHQHDKASTTTTNNIEDVAINNDDKDTSNRSEQQQQ